MKQHYFLSFLCICTIGLLAVQHQGELTIQKYHTFSVHGSGAPPGKTGAPGESTCTSCHGGTAQDGTNENILAFDDGTTTITEYVPGTPLNVMLTMSSYPTTKGFSSTALDDANNFTGNFSSSEVDVQIVDGGARLYATHTANNNSADGWEWTWTPDTDVGQVTFYVATNKSNGSSMHNGDVIYTSQHTITIDSSQIFIETIDNGSKHDFQAGFNLSNNSLKINFTSPVVEETSLNLVDRNGRSIFFKKTEKSNIGDNTQQIQLSDFVESGVYIVHFFLGNTAMSSTIMIQ